MSTGVTDQRMKGQGNQVANGPKEHVNEHEDFDSWRATQHQGYTTTPISTTMASDPYISNYYGTSYPFHQTFGMNDGTWSNSEPVTFLSGYGGQMGHDSYGMEGMFSGAFGQAAAPATGFNYFHGNGDFSTWGNSAAMSRKPHYDEYYRQENAIYPGGEALKGIEQGMQSLGLAEPKVENKEVKDMGQGNQPKKMTWATVASQPAKPQPQVGSSGIKKKGPGMPPPPMVPGKHNMDIGTWEGKNGSSGVVKSIPPLQPPPTQNIRPPAWGGQMRPTAPMPSAQAYLPAPQVPPQRHPVATIHPAPPLQTMPQPQPMAQVPASQQQIMQQQQQQQSHHQQLLQQQQLQQTTTVGLSHPVLEELRIKNNYNPTDFDLSAKGARFFVIKSYSEDDIHRSIKYEIWCSTEHGNKRLDQAYRERENEPDGCVFLFFSVNGSGHFCGMAKMVSPVDYNASSSVWSQDKWKGQFRVRWIYVKDVPNGQLRHIRLENNENKPVTNSRDTQEVPFEKGKTVLRIIHSYRHTTSIFDDFIHYERRQEEEESKKEACAIDSGNQHPPPHHKDHHHHQRSDVGRGGRSGRSSGGRNSNN